jgi:hypothetical protein
MRFILGWTRWSGGSFIKHRKDTYQMKFFIAKMIIMLIGWDILSLPMFSKTPNTIGKPVNTKLTDYRMTTTATVTVKQVDVIATDDIITMKVSLSYTNTSNHSYSWEFYNTALVDAKGKQYTGMSWYIPKSMKSFRDFIRELQPGMTENTFVFFKLPRKAFDGNISFSFQSASNNKSQCLIRIYDKKLSNYDFVKGTTFTSEAWR